MLNPLHGADPRHKAKLVAFPIGICTLEAGTGGLRVWDSQFSFGDRLIFLVERWLFVRLPRLLLLFGFVGPKHLWWHLIKCC